ncbi:ABC transporter ATP-binding protein/permease [Streptomyces sp. 15-116A]|uniref:ABC transporter ATP-binding protein n=1 Tax=Streptomyces sp. 15-116A TaxID=2259035 RepID=UPI0021B2FEB4|nr:ABC transporter ATP-binding protein [Streptomyces sp. 15-116A]MCT7354180.1 ABC transporter ATP-binding protein/permease [Streptomyces sp. 15-116A]
MTPVGSGRSAAPPPGGSGPLRRLAPPARRFLAGRRRVLARLAAWSVAESAQTFLVGYGVAQAVDRGFLTGDTRKGLGWLAVAGVAVVLGAPVIRGVFAQLAGLTEPLRDQLVRRAVDQSMARALARPGGGDRSAVSRLTNQVEIVRDSFAGLVLTLRSFVFTAAGALVGLFSLDPALLVVVVPPLAAGLALFLVTLRPMATAQRRALTADEALGDHAARTRRALRDITACGTQAEAARHGTRLIAEAAATSRVLARWAAVRTLALGVAGQLPVLLLVVAAPWLRGRGVTTGALLGAFTYLAQSLLPALHTLMTALGAAGTRLLVVLDRFTTTASPPLLTGTARAALPQQVPGPLRNLPRVSGPPPAVELRAVTVAYGARAEPVLDALDLRIEDGEHLAVVGPSGIGKSTLTRLIAGTLAPSSGEVAVAGRTIAGRSTAELSALRVLLPQQAYVFTGTVRDNLGYLRPDARRADIEAAVRELGAGPLVERLGGLDAPVRPGDLSQGERQLLVLARAHLSTARLLLLDEATCHLDAASEARAEQALARRPGALLVVAHRMSSAMRADRILVLDGADAACGTHQDLLARSPLYRDLVGHWSGTRE